MVSIIGEKKLNFDRFYRSIGLRFCFLMTTIDQSIIGIDPIDVFFTIGAQLWSSVTYAGSTYKADSVCQM
jgi:hypothetical protein